MFLDTDYKNLSKEQITERLAALRQGRKTGYTIPKKKISSVKKEAMLPGLEGVDDQIAAKILAELAEILEASSEGEKDE